MSIRAVSGDEAVARLTTRRGIPVPLVGYVDSERLAWYGGLGVMTALDLIEWPVAVALASGHLIADRSRNRAVKEFVAGIEAG